MKCVLFVGIIATIFVYGEALKCFHSVLIDSPFKNDSLSINCMQASDRCLKITSGLMTKSTLELRSCTTNSSAFLENVNDFLKNQTIAYACQHYCDSDHCNGAQSMIAISSTILTTLFVSILTSY